MQLGFYFDQTKCSGCSTCCVTCKDWNDIQAGPVHWRRMSYLEEGKFPHPFVAYLSTSCNHCAEPLCAVVCPASAIAKREEDGVVVVDGEKCREEARCGIIVNSALAFGEREAPCKIACPVHLDIPGYVALIAKGKHKEALDLVRQKMPLPAVMGRICNHPCESECRRQEVDEPIAIAALRRFVSDCAADSPPSPIPRTKEERVAIVGSGPAGLAAAYDLVRKGYGVTIFEALPVAGGMLAVGIPEYRLPKDVLQREIDYIKGLGVEIKLNTPIGDGLTLDQLARQGYAATFIAVGAHKGSKLPIPGTELEGTLVGTSFLQDVNMGKDVKLGRRVLVLGGGNVAFDCARNALRLGASEVHLACPESRENMSADSYEIEGGEEEGIIISPSRTFSKILGQDGHVSGVEYVDVERAEFDEAGQLHIKVVKGSEHTLEADTVILAIGQAPDLSLLSGAKDIEITKRGTIAVDPETLETTRPGVFAGGEATSEPGRAIDAIAAGQRAAIFIERYLRGEVVRGELPARAIKAADIKIEIPADIKKAKCQPMPTLPVAERALNFGEVALGLTEGMATAEAERCLNCAGHLCKDVCPYSAPQFGTEENAKMQMCNFCLDRLAENKNPICVDACYLRALDFGPLEQLKAKYGEILNAAGFAHSARTNPSIVFKPKVS